MVKSTKNKQHPQEKTLEQIAYKIPQGKLKILDKEVDLLPMPFHYEKQFLFKLGELLQKTVDSKDEPSLVSWINTVKELLTKTISFEWLDILPDLVKIISDSYQLGYTSETIKEEASIPQMVEIIVTQFNCDRNSSKVASDFFIQFLGKIPSIDQITTLIIAVNHLTNTQSSQNLSSLKSSANDTENLPLI